MKIVSDKPELALPAYYGVLSIQIDATEKDIRAAYLKLAKRYHPDVNKDPKATEDFKRIAEAYNYLMDSERRKKYILAWKMTARLTTNVVKEDPDDWTLQWPTANFKPSYPKFNIGGVDVQVMFVNQQNYITVEVAKQTDINLITYVYATVNKFSSVKNVTSMRAAPFGYTANYVIDKVQTNSAPGGKMTVVYKQIADQPAWVKVLFQDDYTLKVELASNCPWSYAGNTLVDIRWAGSAAPTMNPVVFMDIVNDLSSAKAVIEEVQELPSGSVVTMRYLGQCLNTFYFPVAPDDAPVIGSRVWVEWISGNVASVQLYEIAQRSNGWVSDVKDSLQLNDVGRYIKFVYVTMKYNQPFIHRKEKL